MSEVLSSPVQRRAAAIGVGIIAVATFALTADPFLLLVGSFAAAAAVGAIGLNLIVGTAGQLSLAHPFFLAIGAYGYTVFAAPRGQDLIGLGLPPPVAALAAVLAAGLAGLLFSPMSARLKGLYLGIASLGLVFVGQHVLNTWTELSGGNTGRDVPIFTLAGIAVADTTTPLHILGQKFGFLSRLWLLSVAVAAIGAWFASNLIASRPGRALQAVRDGEIAAAVLGVDVRRAKAKVFAVGAMYAGAAGVLIALAFRRIIPDYFDFMLTVQYLAMITIGGFGSVVGAVVGAAFVTALPELLARVSSLIPIISQPGSDDGGLTAQDAAGFLYGGLIIAFLIFEPGGLAAGASRLFRRRSITTRAVTPGLKQLLSD